MIIVWMNLAILLVVLANLKLLGSSRLVACIRTVALQGIVLGVVPLIAPDAPLTVWILLAAGVSMALKGVVFPWLMIRSMRQVDARREVEPLVGYTTSLLAGLGMVAGAIWLASHMPNAVGGMMLVATAIFTVMVGLFIIVSRSKALTQVLGYLAMENGIYAFGMAVAAQESLLVELGILLDAFMAVFMMGILIYHINREFDHIDTDQMAVLKD